MPVFVADAKGDLSGLAEPGDPAGKAAGALAERARQIGLGELDYRGFPACSGTSSAGRAIAAP